MGHTHYNLDTNTVTIGSLATALMVCVMVFVTAVTIISIRKKVKIKTAIKKSNSTEETIHNEPMYEDVAGTLSSVSVINAQDNVAYRQTQTHQH